MPTLKSAKLKRKKTFSLNLLPKEIIVEEQTRTRINFTRKMSILAVFIFITISLLITFFGLIIDSRVKAIEARYNTAEAQIETFKTKEGLILALKKRMEKIVSLLNQPSNIADSFNLVTALIPEGIKTSLFTINQGNKITLSAEAPEPLTLKGFLDKLTDPLVTRERISKVNLEGVAEGLDGKLHFEVAITLKD